MSSSSDRTKKLSSKVKYNELSTNIRYHGTVTPVKNDGSTYEMFGITKYQKANQSNPSIRNSINTFNSYSERMELKKGRFYTNTPINGIDNLKYDIKGGNLMQINYGSNSPLVATGNLELSGGRLMHSVGENLIPYPSNTVDYPGFITDPNNTIFKKVGVGNTENQQQNWVRNLSTTEFNDSNQWNKLNKSQDLHNFSLTGGVNLWTEFTINVTDVSGAYVMNGIHRKGHLTNEQNPTLYFDPYDTINFVIDASGTTSASIHKFRINTTNYKGDTDDYIVSDYSVYYSSGNILDKTSNQGIADGTITWTPSRKSRYFYNCHQHEKMHGIIIIGDGSEKYPVVKQIIDDVLGPVITADNTQDLSGNSSPSYKFTSNEAGTITITPNNYVTSSSVIAAGENTIEFNNILEGTYDISFIVTDIAENKSSVQVIPTFTINTTSPDISNTVFDMSGTDITPKFTFGSDKAGTINIIPNTYRVTPTSVIDGSNTITFDSLQGDTYDLSFIVTDLYGNTTDIKIPQFTITSNVNETAIISPSQVNVVASNGNKYVFNGENSYNPATIYTLTTNSYTFTDIPEAHPMAILNNNNTSNITYSATSNANSPIIIKVSGGSTTANSYGDYYTFKKSDDTVINIANGGFKFMKGKTYRFDDNGLATTTTQSNGYGTTTTTHPLKIITSANDSTVTNTLNTVGGSITVTIPQNASNTAGDLYYQCSNHPDMRGNLSLLYKQVTDSSANGLYDFYYGNMSVSVTGDFSNVSVYCYHHGYMGGNNLLKYVS